ncbi:hypothetical protein HCJ21_08920 [Listeria seeligeri]|uniref:hypothetical protein n=1 Tax=Listeria seeligeri TaxID=1640 RepID=UPI0010E0BDF0|nr:hypothetical protein [Listeria seeligeri]MBC1578900.1 hypothetical protein [Listeria seeligeri]MBC1597102.1 hypothetical protein [Listeria seeligeri]MBC1599119.1 hypothetical protein [Listeria seeligeri]MBC1723988.1 hypothetical protein [Listeria seeligeri]MBC2045690.1 hypothetical protein [Listeria seeligeri]
MDYQDRGMKKWGGFLLSEHTEAMKTAEPLLTWKESMTTEAIENVLGSAMTHSSMLVIQKKPLDPEAAPEKDIIGRISGVENNTIYIRNSEGIIPLSFSVIRNVEERSVEKWYK